MYRLMTFTTGRMQDCFFRSDFGYLNSIGNIRLGFESNHTDLFPYVVVSCDYIDALRNCFKDPFRIRFRNIKFEEIFYTTAKDLVEIFLFGFMNICYKEDFPIINCLDYVDLGANHQRCVRYELDESKPKQYQLFDVPYVSDPKGVEGLVFSKFFSAARANYSKFFEYVEQRENYTKQVKQQNLIEEYIQMNNDSDKCIYNTKCELPEESKIAHLDDSYELNISCDCFTSIRDCLHSINTTLPNPEANYFFASATTKFGCYEQNFPIVRCNNFGEYIKVNSLGRRETIKRCIHYELDESKPKYSQKFDIPFFYDSNDPKQRHFNKVLQINFHMRSMLVAFAKMITNVDMTYHFF